MVRITKTARDKLARELGLLDRPCPRPVSVSIHEAGHTVVAARLRVPFEFVTIVPEGKLLGRLEKIDPRAELVTGELLHDVATIAFAGIVANLQFDGFTEGWSGDLDDALKISRDARFRRPLPELFERARRIVDDSALWVWRLACELERRRTLTFDEVQLVLGRPVSAEPTLYCQPPGSALGSSP